MNAGRELDALVAEKVMGFAVVDHGEQWAAAPAPRMLQMDVPAYSTDIAAAWEVVERMRTYSDTVSFVFDLRDNSEHRGPPEWLARFDRYHITDEYDGSGGYWRADTGPLAICLAALKAIGVKVTAWRRG